MPGEGYRILLDCRRRSRALRARSFTFDQIAHILALDHDVSPLRAEETDVKRRELALLLGGTPALGLLRHLTPPERERLAAAAAQQRTPIDSRTLGRRKRSNHGSHPLRPDTSARRRVGVPGGVQKSATPSARAGRRPEQPDPSHDGRPEHRPAAARTKSRELPKGSPNP
ncbi:hypothetical protein ACSDR0_31640 [Streptosporangium sp. G11]